MMKEDYIRILKKHGYEIDGNLAYLQINAGVWVQEIEENRLGRGYGLTTVYMPHEGDEVVLTIPGVKAIRGYISELAAKRKEILDASKDTTDETALPTVKDIACDIELTGWDDEGVYSNNWGVTDNYEGDFALTLMKDFDFTEVAA